MVNLEPSRHPTMSIPLPICRRYQASCAVEVIPNRISRGSCTGIGSGFFRKPYPHERRCKRLPSHDRKKCLGSVSQEDGWIRSDLESSVLEHGAMCMPRLTLLTTVRRL